jgi:NhaP-type Na+/H+ or K+/H+ antiporter
VQLGHAHDRDRLRFSLTGEAGLNDGTAFPFVMLGLGLLGLHELGSWGWRWWAVDVVWAITGGLGIGAAVGTGVGKLMLHLRRKHREGLGHDEFLALGVIALSYGAALLLQAYGFLAVLAAGLALRTIERRRSGNQPAEAVLVTASPEKVVEIATARETAPAHLAGSLLNFNEQMERIMEVTLVLIIGLALSRSYLRVEEVWFVALLFLAIRPAAVLLGLMGTRRTAKERGLFSWFGIRGIGSLYYLMYAVNHGLSGDLAWQLISITLTVIAVSIIIHGITVTPLMDWYQQTRDRRSASA